MMTPDDWVLLGYRAREKCPKSDWLNVDNVEEIASVSTCIACVPDQIWTDNLFIMMGFYETPELARQSITDNRLYSIDAYRVSLVVFDDGKSHRITELEMIQMGVSPPPNSLDTGVRPVPIPPHFRFLGYDAVSRSFSPCFECSPLSCNGMAKEIPVNRYCLIDRLEDAIEAARRFSIEQPEPGTYYVVEVWREVVEA